MFKGIGNLTSMMKQASQLTGRMGEVAEQLKARRVVGKSGGDMIQVEADGTGQVLKVTIDSSLVADNDVEMIQDLLPAAINSAGEKAKSLHVEAMQELTGGLGLPGLDGTLEKMMGDLGQNPSPPTLDDQDGNGDDDGSEDETSSPEKI